MNLGRRDARVTLADGVWEQQLKLTERNGVQHLGEGGVTWINAARTHH